MHLTSDEHCSDSTIVIKLKDAKLKKKAKMNIMTGFYVFSLSCYLGYEGDILKGRLYIFTLYAEYDIDLRMCAYCYKLYNTFKPWKFD